MRRFRAFFILGMSASVMVNDKDGRLVTFMDPSVPAESFLRGLKTNNQLNADIAAEIVSAGWFSGSGFWTIGIGVKGTVSGNVPKSLFEFMKYGSGPEGTTYDIKKLHVYADFYVDVSVGYSHPLNGRWTIGGKYKFLVGAGNADIHFTNLHAVMNGDSWRITSQGRMSASVQGLRPTLAADRNGREYIDGFDFRSPGAAGYGELESRPKLTLFLATAYSAPRLIVLRSMVVRLCEVVSEKWNSSCRLSVRSSI